MDGFMVHCCKCDSGFEIDPDNVTCPKCATKTGGTQPTNVQQLKDAIAALAVEMEQAVYPDFSPVKTRMVITKMLLLSGCDKYNAATASV